MKTAAYKRKPTLIVFSLRGNGCRGCVEARRDRAHFEKHFVVTTVYYGTAKHDAYVKKCKAATGHTVELYPVLWPEGGKRVQLGYESRLRLVVIPFLLKIVGGIVDLIVGRPEDYGAGGAAEPPTVTIAAELPEDWSGVRIVVLAAEQDVGFVRGKARSKLIGLGRGRLERKIIELTGGKAAVDLVAERIEPDRYAAVLEAAGLGANAFDVLVLIPKANRGLLKGLVIKKIEGIAIGKLKGVPIEPIFERKHAASYVAIAAALHVEPSEVKPVKTVVETITDAARAKLVQTVFDKVTGQLPDVDVAVGKAMEKHAPKVEAVTKGIDLFRDYKDMGAGGWASVILSAFSSAALGFVVRKE